jgi:hypothetical protein
LKIEVKFSSSILMEVIMNSLKKLMAVALVVTSIVSVDCMAAKTRSQAGKPAAKKPATRSNRKDSLRPQVTPAQEAAVALGLASKAKRKVTFAGQSPIAASPVAPDASAPVQVPVQDVAPASAQAPVPVPVPVPVEDVAPASAQAPVPVQVQVQVPAQGATLGQVAQVAANTLSVGLTAVGGYAFNLATYCIPGNEQSLVVAGSTLLAAALATQLAARYAAR